MTRAPASSPPSVIRRVFDLPLVSIVGLAAALLGVGCGTTTTAPSAASTSPAVPAVSETFSGTLSVGGSRFYSFSISVYGTVNATLIDIGGSGVPPTVEVDLGIGTPSGTTCSTTPTLVQVSGEGGVTSLVTADEQPGTYCVLIADAGNLFSPATFTVVIDHP